MPVMGPMTPSRDGRRLWAIVLTIGVVIGAARTVWLTVFLGIAPIPGGYVGLLANNVAFWTSSAAVCLGVIALGRAFPLSGARRWLHLAFHAVLCLAFPFVHMKAWTLLMAAGDALWHWRWEALAGWPTEQYSLDFLSARFQIEWALTVYWGAVGLAHALAYRDENQRRVLVTAQLDAELARAQLDGLQRQMQPHFLFNSLQSIAALMHRDVPAAERLLERLGLVLRGLLRTSATSRIPLRQELDYVEHYLAIEHVNLGERLAVTKDVEAETLQALVPPLLLQPLVENAVRHAIAKAVDGGRLRVASRRVDGWLELTVTDTGAGSPGAEGDGVALQNIGRRLQLLYPGRHVFSLGPRADGPGTEVHVRLPWEVASGRAGASS